MFKLIYFMVKNLPSSKLINNIRTYLYKPYFKAIGKNNIIGRSVNIANIHNIILCDNITINAEVYLVASKSKIVIGNNVLIAPRCVLQTQNHNYIEKNILIREQGDISSDIIIQDDVWLGLNVMILPGVIIAQGCVIGAGSVVTKSTEPYGVYIGIPAKKIKERK